MELDGVERVGLIVDVQLVPNSVSKGSGTVIQACSVLSLDGSAGYGLGRPNVLEGRLPRATVGLTDLVGTTFPGADRGPDSEQIRRDRRGQAVPGQPATVHR